MPKEKRGEKNVFSTFLFYRIERNTSPKFDAFCVVFALVRSVDNVCYQFYNCNHKNFYFQHYSAVPVDTSIDDRPPFVFNVFILLHWLSPSTSTLSNIKTLSSPAAKFDKP